MHNKMVKFFYVIMQLRHVTHGEWQRSI